MDSDPSHLLPYHSYLINGGMFRMYQISLMQPHSFSQPLGSSVPAFQIWNRIYL